MEWINKLFSNNISERVIVKVDEWKGEQDNKWAYDWVSESMNK